MDTVPLKQQIWFLHNLRSRVSQRDAALLAAAQRTLIRVDALRQHFIAADHDNEKDQQALTAELLSLLGISPADTVVKV